jgi:hypothetical protein
MVGVDINPAKIGCVNVGRNVSSGRPNRQLTHEWIPHIGSLLRVQLEEVLADQSRNHGHDRFRWGARRRLLGVGQTFIDRTPINHHQQQSPPA